MGINQRHIIEKNVLEVEMENPDDSFAFRNRLGEVVHEKIMPAIEILFDEMSAQQQVYRIDALSIDAGTLSVKNWEEELTTKIVEQLRQSLRLHEPVWNNIQPTPVLKKDETRRQVQKLKDSQSKAQDFQFEEIFLYYLQYGRLPWYAPAGYLLQLHAKQWLQTQPLTALSTFFTKATETQLTRFILFADEEMLKRIVIEILPGNEAAFFDHFSSATNWLTTICSRQIATYTGELRELLFLPVFQWFVAENAASDLTSFYATRLGFLLKKNGWDRAVANHIDATNPLLEGLQSALQMQHITGDEGSSLEEFEIGDKELDETNETVGKHGEDKWFIDNAGAILLHPFLHGLFKEIKLVADKQFVDDEARMRAIVVLQYLVTNSTEYEDHQLMLNKILCGFPSNQPVPGDILLTAFEKEEASSLLDQMIKMWTKNGVRVNGTTHGFQEAFLQRSGTIIPIRNEWKMQVEQKPYDLVMSSLPWGISMIKTPWMHGMLWAEWPG